MNTAAFTTRPATDIGFIHFDVFVRDGADPVLIRTHHADAQLVEDLKGRLVARKAKLTLKLRSRHAVRLTGNKIGGPEPHAQRRMRPLHHCPDRQAGVATAFAAAQNSGALREAERISRFMAIRADEPIAPSGFLQIYGASRVIREKPLELRK